jgi:hypothetical protein
VAAVATPAWRGRQHLLGYEAQASGLHHRGRSGQYDGKGASRQPELGQRGVASDSKERGVRWCSVKVLVETDVPPIDEAATSIREFARRYNHRIVREHELEYCCENSVTAASGLGPYVTATVDTTRIPWCWAWETLMCSGKRGRLEFVTIESSGPRFRHGVLHQIPGVQ